MITGGSLSIFLIVAGDDIQPAIRLTVPAGYVPQSLPRAYRILILYPEQLFIVGGILAPQVAPSSKLYWTEKPAMPGGDVTVKSPHPADTTGAGGAGGKITTLTVLLTQEEPAVPAGLPVPHGEASA